MWSGDCVDPKSSGEEDGSITPPLPVRSPAPPAIPPAFLRSHSLGKNEIPGKSKSQPYHNHHHHHQDSSTSEPASVALNLLGRHTHGYPNQVRFEAGNSEITKVIIKRFFFNTSEYFYLAIRYSRNITTENGISVKTSYI